MPQPPLYYKNFVVAIYSRVHEIVKMSDRAWLDETWTTISSQMRVDKFYIELHRDRVVADSALIEDLKAYFTERGVSTAAGLALVADEPSRFESFCYTDPSDRAFVKGLAEFAARHFDEIILDDFFFVNTKKESDIAAKGDLSWTEFRLDLMHEAAERLIIGPARAVNPKVKVVIKYPNWYEHFPALGFDLDAGSKLFDGIYTGTETRNPDYNHQHLQQYQAYEITRYFENIAPGRNGGGWVDAGGLRDLDRYAEQLWLTMFAKAREITLFDWRQLVTPVSSSLRGDWQGFGTSFDFDAAVSTGATFAKSAGLALDQADAIVGKLGNPVGLAAYKPHHSLGEEFLQNYLGMIGVPIEMTPDYPSAAGVVLLTESAACDSGIVDSIGDSLCRGGDVIITSGFLNALQGEGIERIAEWRCNGKRVLTDEFYRYRDVHKAASPILLPQVEYPTNDSWELIGADANGYPLLLECAYSAGRLYCLVVPDNFADLYKLPDEVLNGIRNVLAGESKLRLEGPAQICLFFYDNNTVIVESFHSSAKTITLVADSVATLLQDMLTGEDLKAQTRTTPGGWHKKAETNSVFTIELKARSFRAFKIV